MVSRDSNVVMNVPCAISVSSFPYLKQNIVPNDATGIAIIMVLMFTIFSSKTLMVLNMVMTNRGRIISRSAAMRKMRGLPAIFLDGICDML